MSKYIGTPVVNVSVDTVDVTGDITTTDTTPEVIIVNNTHEDTDGGREGKVTFKGQQSGGEETTLAQIQASHDGTSDDEKGDLIFKTNDGSDGSSPTERMRIDSAGTTTITVTGNEDTLNLISTDADATKGPILNLYRNSASPANDDMTGRINFQAENNAGETITYAQAFSSILNVADGSEDGRYKIGTMGGGNFNSRMDMTNEETVFNDDSKDLNFRVESDSNANALFVDAGNDVVVVGSNVAENRLAQPFAVTSAGARGGMTVNSFFNSASGPILDFQVSRNNTAGSHTIIQTNDALGTIIFRGDDGDEFKDAAGIEANVDASPGNDDMAGRLCFFTAPDGSGGLVERMRINNSGQVLIGTTTWVDSGTKPGLSVQGAGGGPYVILCKNQDTGGGANQIKFSDGSDDICGVINSNATSNTTSYGTSSDYRLKENVTDVSNAISTLKTLRPKTYNFISDPDNTPENGFLAHELAAVVPNAVTGEKDAMTEAILYQDGDEIPEGKEVGDVRYESRIDPQQVDYGKLTPILTAALQEAIAKIETLETKVAALEGE